MKISNILTLTLTCVCMIDLKGCCGEVGVCFYF